jgi:hypothetical protein
MFSDSVLVWGEQNVEEILGHLQMVYLNLVDQTLLLRGAIVQGALEKDPRVEARGFRKFLPTNDTLARAVGLANTLKGSRLLIESSLATKLLETKQEWLTIEGYLRQPYPDVALGSILRRICPDPSATSYELLYFWKPQPATASSADVNGEIADRLAGISEFQDRSVAEHMRETIKLLRRSEKRRRTTERTLVDVIA